MSEESLEALSGVGQLLNDAGRVIEPRVTCYVVRWRRRIDAGAGDTIPRTVGSVLAAHTADYIARNAKLILRLEDGRQVPFSFTHTNGTIASRGHGRTDDRTAPDHLMSTESDRAWLRAEWERLMRERDGLQAETRRLEASRDAPALRAHAERLARYRESLAVFKACLAVDHEQRGPMGEH